MARMRFYTTERIGPKREYTPEGFLCCYDVPIGRTGTMHYGEGEVPVEPGPDGVVFISREAEDLFSNETMASFNGKPVVNDHPPVDVVPDNWRELALGTVMNVRKGQDGLLIADLLIMDKEGIALVLSGKVEVSCGYDADYEETGKGTGRQRNITGNHLALVEKGRCGPRCAIGDKALSLESSTVSKKKSSFKDFLIKAFGAKTADAQAELLKEAEARDGEELTEPGSAIHVHIGSNPGLNGIAENTLDDDVPGTGKPTYVTADALAEMGDKHTKDIKGIHDRLDSLEGLIAGKNKDADKSEAVNVDDADITEETGVTDAEEVAAIKGAKDSARFADAHQSAVALAEVIKPGVKTKTFDAAAEPRKTIKALHKMRVSVLAAAAEDPVLAELIKGVLPGKELNAKKLSFADSRAAFRAVGAARKHMNNATATRDTGKAQQKDQNKPAPVKSIADLNRKLSEHNWK